MLHSQNQLEISGKRKKSLKNRRKYTRIEAAHKVTVDKVTKSDQQLASFSIVARTLDLSKGGLRLATDNPLESNTLVKLLFGAPFPESLHSATGEVSWCNKQIDEPGYHVGISFKNEKVMRAMGDFIN